MSKYKLDLQLFAEGEDALDTLAGALVAQETAAEPERKEQTETTRAAKGVKKLSASMIF